MTTPFPELNHEAQEVHLTPVEMIAIRDAASVFFLMVDGHFDAARELTRTDNDGGYTYSTVEALEMVRAKLDTVSAEDRAKVKAWLEENHGPSAAT